LEASFFLKTCKYILFYELLIDNYVCGKGIQQLVWFERLLFLVVTLFIAVCLLVQQLNLHFIPLLNSQKKNLKKLICAYVLNLFNLFAVFYARN